MTSCGRSRCLASFHTFTRICNGKRRRRGLIMLFPDPCLRATSARYSLQRSRNRRDHFVNRPDLTHHLFILIEC
jgi:hypothetical protein